MPKRDGWEVLSALKADADLRDIPVVIVTMLSDRGIGLVVGAVDVLTKPVDRARLTALIHSLVRPRWSGLSCRGRRRCARSDQVHDRKNGFSRRRGGRWPPGVGVARRSFGAGHDPAGPDDAGDGTALRSSTHSPRTGNGATSR